MIVASGDLFESRALEYRAFVHLAPLSFAPFAPSQFPFVPIILCSPVSLILESRELEFVFCWAELFSCRHATITYSGAFDRCSPSCSFRLTALV